MWNHPNLYLQLTLDRHDQIRRQRERTRLRREIRKDHQTVHRMP